MDIGFAAPLIALVMFLIWFWNSLYVIKEWESVPAANRPSQCLGERST